MNEQYFYCVKCGRTHLVVDCGGLKIQCQCGAVYKCEKVKHYSPTNDVIYQPIERINNA